MRAGRQQRGQVLVETAIIMPVMIFVILGALQLMMMMHARVMTEYAAFNAARAGIVHNADANIMRNAASIAALPLYHRTDNWRDLGLTWGLFKAVNELTQVVDSAGTTAEEALNSLLGVAGVGPLFRGSLPDVSLVEVEVTSPVVEDIETGQEWQRRQVQRSESDGIDGPRGRLVYPDDELDFDDREMIMADPRTGRLAVKVRVLVPLRIPLVNWIFFQLWYARTRLNILSVESNQQDWSRFQARVARGGHAGQTLEEAIRDAPEQGVFDDPLLSNQAAKEAKFLRLLAAEHNVYLIPMYATYAMQMQSNPFMENARPRVWFGAGD